ALAAVDAAVRNRNIRLAELSWDFSIAAEWARISSGSASSRTASAARRQWESPGSFGCSLQPLRLRLRRRLRPVSPRTLLACGHALPVCGPCGFRSGCVREREIPRLRLRGLRRARLDAVLPDAAGVAPVARANVRGADRTERRHIGVHVQ